MDKPGLRDALPQPKLSDTRTDPFWSNLDSSLSAAAAPSTTKTPQRDLDVGLGDVARGVGAGALDLVGGIGELARQASKFGKERGGKSSEEVASSGGDYLEQARANMASKLSPVLDVVAGAGDLAKSGAESLTEGMSGDAKEAIGRSLIDETPEGRLTMGDGAGDLDVWAMKMAQGVGSMVPTLLAGGVTGAAAKASIGRAVTTSMIKRGATQEVAEAVAAKTVAKLATGAAVTTGATGSVGSAGVNTRESVLGMSFDELSQSDTFRQAFTRIDQDQQTQHLSDEEKLSLAREETANVASRATMSDAKVWGAAAMGSVMGDAMLFKMLAGKAATSGVLKGAAKGAVGEGIGETLEEGVQQYTINESLNEVAAADIDPMKGVVSSALEGGLIGMGTGGALGGAGGLRGSKSQPESEGGAQVDPATVEDVAPVEQGDPMQANPAAAPADPDLVPAADTMADPVVAPSGEQSPLGPSASQFDELRDVPAYLRRDDTAERFKGMAADSEVQRALAGEFGQSVQELVSSQMQAGDQGKSLYERAQAGELGLDPFAGNKSAQQVAMENQRPALPLKDVIFAGDANAARGMTKEGHFDDKQAGTGPQFRGAERTRWKSGQEGDVLPPESSSTKPAGELPGAVIEGEAREVGTELPHRDVVYGADQRQPDAKPMRGSATESAVGPLQTLRITRKGKPFATEKEAAMASRKGKEMPVPLNGGGFGVAEIAEVEQVKAAATTQPSAPQLNDISVTNQNQPSDQPAASVSAETVPAPSVTSGEASQLAPAIDTGYREVIPVNQPQTEVSNEPVTPVPAISSEGQGDQPGAGEPAAAGAGPAVAGLTDRAGSGNPADNTPAPPVPDGQQQNDPTLTAPATDAGAAVSGRIGEEELRDRDLLKEHGGHWKYRSAVGAGWFTANTKEAAIERAEEAYRKAVSKGEPVPTRDERFAQADAELFSEMDRRYGKMSTPELEAEYQRLGGEVGDLQKSGSGEFNGNGGRRTGAAVSNEGARQVGEERLRLGVYMKMRRDRDTVESGAKSQQIEPANDWSGAKSAADYHAAKRRLFSGEMEFSEFQAMSRSALDNAPSLRAELEKKTKQDLLDQLSRFNAARYKNDKKAVVVEAAYNQLIGDLRWAANGDGNTISETYAIGGARQSIEERVAKALDGLTPERYQLFRDKQLSDVAEMQRRREELKQSLTDPQTLGDFKAFIERRGIDKLTQEQRARYEDMVAARNLDRREQERSAKGNGTAPSATSSDIIKTKHTKTGDDLFVVQMGDRVERDAYNRINAHAKTMGGWYSSFRGKGAVPGFQFKSEEKATEFRAWLGGEVGGASPEVAPVQSTDSEAQPAGKSKQVEALRNRAASARAKAEAVFNADRKENTARRASMAANARANAERDLRFAGLLEAIATGIESGEITYLRNLANGAQLEELQSALNRGLWSLPATKIDALVSDGVINRDDSSRYSWSDKATPEQMVEGVSMPGMDYHTDRLREVAIKMQGASGFKQAGAKVMSLVKAAANRDNKTTTLSDPELIAKLKAYVTGSDDYSTSTIKDQIAGYGRLERMGITNHTELRAALRELVRLQRGLNETAPQRDPVTEKTNALKRRLLNNRNAFIDFFPTPEEYAADLVDRLGIEPGMVVLEPSAGHGMLAEAARDAGATVEAVELAGDLRDILQEKGFSLVGDDFMETAPSQRYDAVIMNPPFSNDMDIDHVRHAFAHLKPGGRLAAIVSSMAGQRSNKKNKAFREWLDDLGASEEMMPEGAFKDSLNPTSVRTKIITIEKPVDSTANSDSTEQRAVSFSKQAMAQGEKPAKHLTRKEAELVTKEWFKQYRGASGIDVQIHATQAELEKALGLAAKDGLIRRAAFDDDNGTLHVAADTIANPKRMREILRHEVLAHYGLANVLGDGEYTKLISRIIKSKSAPSMKAVWDWVDTHYAGEDVGVQAEEVIAHLAELEQSAWRRGWDQVVAWVTKALRTVGFVPGGITAAETRVLIEGLGKKMKRGGPDNGGPDGGHKFSQESEQSTKMSQESLGETIEVDGKLRPTTNSSGQPIHPTEDGIRAFWRWFGDSKVVDDNGRPLVVYHGTPADISAFEPTRAGEYGARFADAVFFSSDPAVAGAYSIRLKASEEVANYQAEWDKLAEKRANIVKAGGIRSEQFNIIRKEMDAIAAKQKAARRSVLEYSAPSKGANVIPAYLRTKDPFVADGKGGFWSEINGDAISGAISRGNDGVIITNVIDSASEDTSYPADVYVVFSPEQIKSSVGNGGEFDGGNPDIRFSQTNTAADKAMEKLNLGPKPDIIDKTKANLDKLRKVDRGVVESWVDRFIKKANTEVLDALAPIKYAEDAAGITDAADSGYVAARMATGAASTMQATMLYGLPEWKDGVIQRKAGTGEKDALLGIFSDLGADLHNWLGWMAGHRAELLMAQGRENLLDANDIAALKGQGKGKEAKFLDAKARWNRLNAATLDLAQEAGLFTKEARAEFESEWYIPFFRESEDGDVIAPFKPKGIANQNAGIKKLKGGEANTNDLLENIFTSTSKLIDASMKNMAAQKTVWNLADTGLIEVIPKPNKMDYQALANGKDRIMLKLEGEEYMLRVEDPDLYRAMTFFDRKPFGKMTMMASSAKRILTAGVTASPEFMLRNFLRDSLSSWAISKDGFKPVIDSIKGVKKTLAMDGSTIDVMFSGASFLGGYVNGNDPGAMADTVRKSLRRKGMTPEQIARYEKSIIRNAAHAKGVVADAWEKYSRYGEALENANREAVYAAAIKAGKSHAQAAFESKDLMDFSMLGAARAIQGASLVLPFFNARLQGLGKLSRELRDNPREIAKRAGMITAMSLGLLAANWDDERYEELPDWDKDANWHFFVGDQHFRIPKPFEIGVMFGTIPERMVRAMGDKDTGAQFGKAVARAIGDTFALNPTPQIIKPLVEAAFNYDTFRGGPIDSPQDLAVKAEARYNEQTSLLMRELGELSGFSPKQLEHLVIGYTGTIGGYVMATADGLIRASRPGESASWRADEIPLVKAVYRGTGPAKSTQHMEEFYRMLNEVNQLKRTVDQYRSEGLDDKANELLEEQGGILKARRSLSRTQQQVRVVRNKIELIQRDRTMNAEEKRKRIDELLARRNDLVYQAVNKNRENWE
ncbi:LPD38 domain-containing protein [Aeromonas veronii]|uniref:LPD38 domain-containing protein n=1 Tax=Aeromonas veronii TaxID=654 RepID=UPI003D2058E0